MGAAVATNLIKDFLVPGTYKKFVPIPSAVSIPFFIGAPIAIDFCMGGAIMLIWYACQSSAQLAAAHHSSRMFRNLEMHWTAPPPLLSCRHTAPGSRLIEWKSILVQLVSGLPCVSCSCYQAHGERCAAGAVGMCS